MKLCTVRIELVGDALRLVFYIPIPPLEARNIPAHERFVPEGASPFKRQERRVNGPLVPHAWKHDCAFHEKLLNEEMPEI